MNSKRDIEKLDDVTFLARKIKLEHKLFSDKIYKNHPDINISEYEIKTGLIQRTFKMDYKDIIVTVAKTLRKLLKENIESLKLSAAIKNALKKLKSFLFLTEVNSNGSNKNGSENGLGSETKTNEATTTKTTRTKSSTQTN